MLFVLLLDPLWVTVAITTTSIGLELKLHNDDDLLDQEELLKTIKKITCLVETPLKDLTQKAFFKVNNNQQVDLKKSQVM